jgi:predicted aconitase
VMKARDQLTTREAGELIAVSLGTPHLSLQSFERLAGLIRRRRFSQDVDVWVSTARDTLEQARVRGFVGILEGAGARMVTDTCTYITPILRRTDGIVMTDSAKWAWYAPGNLGVEVAFGSMAECVTSAVAGRIVRDPDLWS